MTISELKLMKSSQYVLFKALFRNLHRLILGGIVQALGATLCHFIGMESVVSDSKIVWMPGIVASAVIIALVASIVAYWILFRLLALFPRLELLRLTSSMLGAIAFSGMHYAGSSAAQFEFVDGKGAAQMARHPTVDQDKAMVWAIVLSILFLLGCFILITADLRAWYYNNGDTLRGTDNIMYSIEHTSTFQRATINAASQKYKDIRPSYAFYSPPLLSVNSVASSSNKKSSDPGRSTSIRERFFPRRNSVDSKQPSPSASAQHSARIPPFVAGTHTPGVTGRSSVQTPAGSTKVQFQNPPGSDEVVSAPRTVGVPPIRGTTVRTANRGGSVRTPNREGSVRTPPKLPAFGSLVRTPSPVQVNVNTALVSSLRTPSNGVSNTTRIASNTQGGTSVRYPAGVAFLGAMPRRGSNATSTT
eukprot:CAMPEP_0119039264 /NCGR_PEP_ID=MMETSP1177-20130426/8659_1 /TAXON_ID=2985 /ORGANISM="Ochromonas sp, Strain CCMP1899" /LENGTH=417 /DNA_ID=CAMNT_0007002927 /DNA_START=677 /DNA_END=1930 /DNA_ORIENTATION=-